jgi:H+/Cl- antiporter ClcA
MKPVRWRWACIGAIVGVAIVLADLLLEWRGNQFMPWQGDGLISNISQVLTMIVAPAFIGLAVGYWRDLRRLKGR